MSCSKSSVVVRIAFFVLILTLALTLQAEPGDEDWDGRYFINGLSWGVTAAVVDDRGDIIVSGSFMSADDVLVNHIARWDGSRWHALGDGLSGSVRSLIFDDSGNLFAGGYFQDAGGDPAADCVAVWDGVTWSAIGAHGGGLPSAVYALAFDSLGNLYAGGTFTNAGGDPDADRIAVWDGSSWASIGGPGSGVNGNVSSLAFSLGDVLVIGGAFTDAGGNAAADYIAGWNGSGWSAIGGGLNGGVTKLVFADNGDLYVGGTFTDAGGIQDADRIAVWTSPSWHAVGAGGGLNDTVQDIALDSSGTLFVCGDFDNAGGDPDADRVAKWTPSGWDSIGTIHSAFSQDVDVLVIDGDDAPVAGGFFLDAGGDGAADYLVRWSGSHWFPLSRASLPAGAGLSGTVYALAVDATGRLFAGGGFQDAGNQRAADYVAVLDGSGWSAMGGPTNALSGDVFALAFDDEGDLIVGGDQIEVLGDSDMFYIARWDGVSWSSLGSGLDDKVSALVLGDDGLLYAGGNFDDVGGDPDADNVAVWNGATWSGLVGPGGGLGGEVYDLAFDDAGNLYAAGDFYDGGGDPDADYVAMWNGTAWTSIGGPGSALDNYAFAVALDDQGRLYVGGDGFFYSSGTTDYVVMWDGASWTGLGTGLNDVVRDLVFDGAGDLYAVGQFDPDAADPDHPREIAVWDGVSWGSLGAGLEDDGYVLAYDGGHNVYVGGVFDWAGNTPSSKIGCYTGATPAALLFADGFESGDVGAWSP